MGPTGSLIEGTCFFSCRGVICSRFNARVQLVVEIYDLGEPIFLRLGGEWSPGSNVNIQYVVVLYNRKSMFFDSMS
jgi:hypothetical protein